MILYLSLGDTSFRLRTTGLDEKYAYISVVSFRTVLFAGHIGCRPETGRVAGDNKCFLLVCIPLKTACVRACACVIWSSKRLKRRRKHRTNESLRSFLRTFDGAPKFLPGKLKIVINPPFVCSNTNSGGWSGKTIPTGLLSGESTVKPNYYLLLFVIVSIAVVFFAQTILRGAR